MPDETQIHSVAAPSVQTQENPNPQTDPARVLTPDPTQEAVAAGIIPAEDAGVMADNAAHGITEIDGNNQDARNDADGEQE